MLFARIREHAENQPEKIALKDEQHQITYQQLWKKISSNRQLAYQCGFSAGKRVVLGASQDIFWLIDFLSLGSLGVSVIPVAPNVSLRVLEQISTDLRPELILTDVNRHTVFGSSSETDDLPTPDWATGESEILYQPTSGSTGLPKYSIRTLGQLTAEAISYQRTLEINSDDVLVNPLPFYHSYALGFAGITSMLAGSTLVITSPFVPRKYLNVLEREKATISLLVPVMARTLGKVYLPEPVDLSNLRIWLVGAGKITDEMEQAIHAKFGTSLCSNYGSTETGGIVSRLERQNLKSVGRPMSGVELEIRDREGQSVPLGTEGFIWVRIPAMLSRYWCEEAIFDRRGFFKMGDLGYLDEAGYVYLVGREKAMINIGGKKVNPLELEEFFLQHPKIKDVAVFGIERPNGEEMIKAVIVGEGDLLVEEIRGYAQANLENHQVPTIISIVPHLPRNELGKILKDELL